MMEALKIIVTNHSALQKKYKSQTEKVLSLLKKLIAADKKKGIDTSVINLDDMTEMKKVNGRAVTNPSNEKQNVTAVQKIFDRLNPDYLVLFGSADIIPFIRIKNPVYNRFEDSSDVDDDGNTTEKDREDGEYILSDLPYTCDIPFTKDYEKYTSTNQGMVFRVVGRIPDIIGESNIPYITKVVKHAIDWKTKQRSAGRGFALSTDDWSSVTSASIKSLFGNKFDLLISKGNPGPVLKFNLIKSDIHLINCHGGPGNDFFSNSQDGTAISSNQLDKQIKKGTIGAAECCFGAQLYFDPQQNLPMASNYLEEGATGFLGSSTTSYGASNVDAEPYDADIMTKYFLKYILQGRSTGSALQQARIDFKRDAFSLEDGLDILMSYKTLIQFYLLGDPSIHYVKKKVQTEAGLPKGISNRRKAAAKRSSQIIIPQITTRKIAKSLNPTPRKLADILLDYNMEGSKVQTIQVTATAPAMASINISGKRRKSLIASEMKPKSKTFTQHVVFKKKETKMDGKKNKEYRVLFITQLPGQIMKTKYLVSK
ncbi:MAG: hypothetical protein ABIQ11_11240 [Saprospiraceae bacterium]